MNSETSPELSFLKRGDLFRLVRKDLQNAVAIASSILLGKRRDFSKDSERLAKNIESAVIIGTENIPITHTPIIIACNHPDIYDLVAGTIHITQAFNEKRREHNLPGDIHWLVTENIPPREVMKYPTYKALYGLIDWGLKKLNHTYNFIPVPINVDKNKPNAYAKERRHALLASRQYLRDETGSRTIGIFPEGDITMNEEQQEFYNGIGILAKPMGTSDVSILPTGIYRDDKGQLTVAFGQPITVDKLERIETVTEKVKGAINQVNKISSRDEQIPG